MVEARHGNFSNSWKWKEELELLLRRHLSAVPCRVRDVPWCCVCVHLWFSVSLVLKPCKVFPWGILGERCFSRRIQRSATCGVPDGDQWDWTNGCDSVWGGFSTASNPPTKLWALQKTGFPHDFQTTGALAHESMTTPFPQALEGGKKKTKNGHEPHLEAEIWGLAWFTLKKVTVSKNRSLHRETWKAKKNGFFFFSCQSMVHKKTNKPQTNFSKWYCRTLGTSSYWFQWHLLTLSRIFQLESSKLTVLRGRMLLQNHWCSRECVEEGWPFH